MNFFEANAAFEPNNQEEGLSGTDARGHCPLQNRLDMFVCVVGFPRRPINVFPFGAGHAEMVGYAVIQVVLVYIRIHPRAGVM